MPHVTKNRSALTESVCDALRRANVPDIHRETLSDCELISDRLVYMSTLQPLPHALFDIAHDPGALKVGVSAFASAVGNSEHALAEALKAISRHLEAR